MNGKKKIFEKKLQEAEMHLVKEKDFTHYFASE